MIGKLNLSKKSGGGSADVVNGIIEQYLAENETIDANTFVEFVNHYYNDVTLDSNKYSINKSSAVLIDTNRVFIAHQSGNTNPKLIAKVCTITKNNIKIDINTVIYNNGISSASSVLVSKNKVFVVYADDNKELRGAVCTINENILTFFDRSLAPSFSYPSYISAVLIDTNSVFVALTGSSSAYPFGIVFKIGEDTIVGGDYLQINNVSQTKKPSLTLLDTNKTFITFAYNTNNYLAGRVCTINDTTITLGTSTRLLSNTGSSKFASSTLIDTNKVFVSHSSDDTNHYLNALICTINGTTITTGSDTQLSNYSSTYIQTETILLDTNKVFVSHSNDNTNHYLNALICTINGTTITTGDDTTLSTQYGSYGTYYSYARPVLLGNGDIFIIHESSGSTNYLNGLLCSVNGTEITTTYEDPTIKPSVNRIDGLTKTSGTSSSPADVWVLDNE